MASNFEFDALRFARNYRRALLREFEPYLKGEVIEVGAGIGQFTELLLQLPQVQRVLAIEPNASFCEELRRRLADSSRRREEALIKLRTPPSTLRIGCYRTLNGTVADLEPGTTCDAIVSVNVLEHIEDDVAELTAYAQLLKEKGGALCLFVPARQEIYAPLDKDFGHFRRYSKRELKQKLQQAGLTPIRLNYFNFIGYFAWWFNFHILRQRSFSEGSVRFFDRVIFPVVHKLESQIVRPPIGQSLLASAPRGSDRLARSAFARIPNSAFSLQP